MLPDRNRLARGLREAIGCRALEILNRRPNPRSSTFPSEIVKCVLDKGETRRVLCKYSGGIQYKSESHSRGVEYEASVYRHVLQPNGTATVAFLGSYNDPQTGWTWLITEHLARVLRLDRSPKALTAAAAWIGSFHAATRLSAVDPGEARLHRWDEAYYRNWAMRTREHVCLATDGLVEGEFLAEAKLESCIRRLVEAEQSVVHGEYYPHNVLVRDGKVVPIDWEAASIGPGEIDLAAMTERWSIDDVIRSKQAYCQSRWPEGAPPHFEQTFLAAQVYWQLRWLGGPPPSGGRPRHAWRWRELANRLAQLGEVGL